MTNNDLGVDLELLVLDENFDTVGVVDVYESFVWTDRYQEAGDVELVVPATVEMLDILKLDRCLIMKASDKGMIIDEILLESHVEEGNKMTVKGRSLEAMLDRRVVWFRVDGTDSKTQVNLQDAIEKILNDNCISPTDEKRKLPRLVFQRSEDPNITQHLLMEDHWGDNIYELICKQAKAHNFGWRIRPSLDGVFTFELYFGVNRSFSQDLRPWVVFSPHYDNFLNSNYYITAKGYATAILGVGAKEQYYEGADLKVGPNITVEVLRNDDGGTGMARRELAIDCTEITGYPQDEEGSEGSSEREESVKESILRQMREKAKNALEETGTTETYDGEAEITLQFVYGRDFFVGDIVQLQNGFGMDSVARVSEVLFSYDMGGFSCIPTFTGIDESYVHTDTPVEE